MEPSSESLTGSDPAAVMRRFVLATRPKFFTASVLPVVLGTVQGALAANGADLPIFLLALGATVFVHAAANVLNDVYDDKNGTDARNTQRIYPYTGGSRFIQNAVIGAAAMARLGWGLLAVGVVLGGVLTVAKGVIVIVFGVAGVSLGVFYSTPPLWLSARGLGEFAVGLAFGVLPVVGAAWLQTGAVEPDAVLVSIPVALWVVNVLLIDEVPDAAADAAVGRRTLAVRLGRTGTARLYFALSVAAAATVALAVVLAVIPIWAAAVSAGLLWPAAKAMRAIRTGTGQPNAMKRAIEWTLAVHAIGTTLLIAALLAPR